MVIFKYKEDVFINDFKNYIESTYGQHYINDGKLQVVDVWHARGSLSTTAIDTALKYLMRYGKKDGRNKKDLMKAVHYILLTMYADGLLDNTAMEPHYDETHPEPFLEDHPHEYPRG
ncbi:DUF3310 domain-containing protein [bacterium]|nr:DUF3310 domain-containing protein [bacterium]